MDIQAPLTMTIYTARCREDTKNVFYPDRHEVTNAGDLRQAAAFDHVCAEYRDNRRSNQRFIKSDCLPLDLDNEHSDDPEEWKTVEDIQAAFHGVSFYVVPSRNNMKRKGDRSERPRLHVYFPIDTITDAAKYRRTKEQTLRIFPWFDDGAKDPARLLFGVENPEAISFPGPMTLTAFLAQQQPFTARGVLGWNDPINEAPRHARVIPSGQRNKEMSHKAGQLLKRFGVKDGSARAKFDEYAARCSPPLDPAELETIWNSALQFYRDKVITSPEYVPPEQYAPQDDSGETIPENFTDVGQAKCFSRLYRPLVCYSDATAWMAYDGKRWTENGSRARGLVHRLTDRQLKQARGLIVAATDVMLHAQEQGDNAALEQARSDKAFAEQYHGFARRSQQSARISAVLTEATPYLQIDVKQLDSDPFLLNTPAGAVDLHNGAIRPNDPEDYCTKLTGCAPGSDGAELFRMFLDRVTCGDAQLQEYLQLIAGMFAVGAVYRECLIIAYGSGGNGKSTLFNLLSYVLGDYAGNLSAETLTANCRKNKSPEYAELRGRRLVIAAELEEGMRFDTAIIKKVCSTDPIFAEPKYRQPFSFIPSHTLVLYTNHLPKVGTTDSGTWDRLIVIPFKAKLRNEPGEVLNYAQYLFEHAGGAVLQWMIEGAQRFIRNGYHIQLPDCVKAAIGVYRDENDWLTQFIESCCDVDPTYQQASGALYQQYRQYGAATGDYTRSTTDFKRAMEASGFEWRKGIVGNTYRGIRLRLPMLADKPYPFTPAENPLLGAD